MLYQVEADSANKKSSKAKSKDEKAARTPTGAPQQQKTKPSYGSPAPTTPLRYSLNRNIRKAVPAIVVDNKILAKDGETLTKEELVNKYKEMDHPNNNFFVLQNIINGARKEAIPVIIKNTFIGNWPAYSLWRRQSYLANHPVCVAVRALLFIQGFLHHFSLM